MPYSKIDPRMDVATIHGDIENYNRPMSKEASPHLEGDDRLHSQIDKLSNDSSQTRPQ